MATGLFKSSTACFGISLAYLSLAILSSATRAPWCDEAFFGETGYNLAAHGRLASTVEPPSIIDDPKTEGTDRFTFYALPLHLALQGIWFKIAGFGLMQLRLISVIFGLAAIGAWYVILESLFAQRWITICGVALIALDYSFLHSASEGRMDMMSASLGFIGLACYLRLRSHSLTKSLWLAFVSEAAAFYTHPVGGGLSAAVLLLAILWFDRRNLKLRHLVPAAVPYLIFAAAWGLYIMQDPHIFSAQFFANSAGRLSAWKQPLTAVVHEFHERYAGPFGMTPGAGTAKRIKSFLLLAYFVGLLKGLGRLRSSQGLLAILGLLVIVLLTFVESTKAASYLVHVIPYLAASFGIFIGSCIAHGGLKRLTGAGILAGILAIQLAGSVYLIRKDEYHREYLPAVRYLKSHRKGNEPVIGISELCFSLGFVPGWTDDWRLGYYNGRTARFIVEDSTYKEYWQSAVEKRPDVSKHIQDVLKNYHISFETPLYKIYERI